MIQHFSFITIWIRRHKSDFDLYSLNLDPENCTCTVHTCTSISDLDPEKLYRYLLSSSVRMDPLISTYLDPQTGTYRYLWECFGTGFIESGSKICALLQFGSGHTNLISICIHWIRIRKTVQVPYIPVQIFRIWIRINRIENHFSETNVFQYFTTLKQSKNN